MKRILKMTALALIIVLGSSVRYSASAQYDDDYYDDSRDVDYQTFYDELSPHGNWIEYPGYGYVWQPGMGPDFRPYSSGGHWVWSDQYEWVWVSEYDWGWAPFHYGRWFHDPFYGWLWVPGYEWSGAWVTWRDGGDYYGWAPIRPGISISINFNIGGYSPPIDWWCFTPRRYILYPRIYNHCIDYRRNVTIINYTTIINNYHYGDRYGWRSGPRRYDAERYVGRINPVRFRSSSRPGRTEFRNNEVSIYRPNVRQQNNTGVAPRKFDRYDRTGDNRTVRTNDTRNGNSDRTFRRNDNSNPGNRDINTRTNELPNRDRTNDRRFDRRNDNPTRQQQTNDNPNPVERRRFDRTDNNNGNSQPNRDTRVIRPERTNPGNNNGNNNRSFERRNNTDMPVRQPQVRTQENTRPQRQMQQMERRQQAPQQMERRQQAPQQMERRQQAPQQMERRQQAPQQMERRQAPQRVEQRQQPQQQQRQVEHQNNGNSDDGKGNGKGNGKRRF